MPPKKDPDASKARTSLTAARPVLNVAANKVKDIDKHFQLHLYTDEAAEHKAVAEAASSATIARYSSNLSRSNKALLKEVKEKSLSAMTFHKALQQAELAKVCAEEDAPSTSGAGAGTSTQFDADAPISASAANMALPVTSTREQREAAKRVDPPAILCIIGTGQTLKVAGTSHFAVDPEKTYDLVRCFKDMRHAYDDVLHQQFLMTGESPAQVAGKLGSVEGAHIGRHPSAIVLARQLLERALQAVWQEVRALHGPADTAEKRQALVNNIKVAGALPDAVSMTLARSEAVLGHASFGLHIPHRTVPRGRALCAAITLASSQQDPGTRAGVHCVVGSSHAMQRNAGRAGVDVRNVQTFDALGAAERKCEPSDHFSRHPLTSRECRCVPAASPIAQAPPGPLHCMQNICTLQLCV